MSQLETEKEPFRELGISRGKVWIWGEKREDGVPACWRVSRAEPPAGSDEGGYGFGVEVHGGTQAGVALLW